MRAAKTNILANHPEYAKIMHLYNEELQSQGTKINNLRFFRDVVSKEIPGYPVASWYKFLKRFKTEHGILPIDGIVAPRLVSADAEDAPAVTMRANGVATADMIQRVLNISADAAQKLADDPTLLTTKERIELGLKVMKAQDSRIHAIGKVREDNREQERFDRAFDGAAFG